MSNSENPLSIREEEIRALSAYLLYINENLIRHTSKCAYWNTKTDGPFTITRTCINVVLERAIDSGLNFRSGPVEKRKDRGRALANNITTSNGRARQGAIRALAEIFGLLDFPDFERSGEFERYIEKLVNGDLQEKLFDESFIFYYWKGDDVGKARLDLKYTDSDRICDCQIRYYSFIESKDVWEAGDPKTERASELPKPDIFQLHSNTYLTIKRVHPTFLIIHSHDTNIRGNSFLFCSYTTVDPQQRLFAGIGILERVSRKMIGEKLQAIVSPEVFNVLFQRRSFLRDPEHNYTSGKSETSFGFKTDFTKHTKSSVNRYAGVYKGYYLDRELEGDKQALRILLLQIHSSGKISIVDGTSGLEGFCSFTGNAEILYITADFKFEVGGIPRFQITLSLPQDETVQLEGVYGGYSKTNKPYIGLIRLDKLDGYANISDAQQAGHRARSFQKEQQIGPEYEGAVDPDIIRFFNSDRFYNNPISCLSEHLHHFKSPGGKPKYLGRLSGFFYIYSTLSKRSGVVRYPLMIKTDGTVMLKNSSQSIEFGQARSYFKNDYLILEFTDLASETERPSKGIYLFYTHHSKAAKFCVGVSVRINDDDNPQAKKEHLLRYPFGPSDKSGKIKTPDDLFAESKCERFGYDDQIYRETLKYYKHLDSLFGREYNLITVAKTIDREDKALQRECFDKLYLNQAILEFLSDVNSSSLTYEILGEDLKVKVTRYIKLAREHGVFTTEKLSVLLNEFLAVTNRDSSNIHSIFIELFNNLDEYFSLQDNDVGEL